MILTISVHESYHARPFWPRKKYKIPNRIRWISIFNFAPPPSTLRFCSIEFYKKNKILSVKLYEKTLLHSKKPEELGDRFTLYFFMASSDLRTEDGHKSFLNMKRKYIVYKTSVYCFITSSDLQRIATNLVEIAKKKKKKKNFLLNFFILFYNIFKPTEDCHKSC